MKVYLFYVIPKIDIKPLSEMFRANVLKMLKKEGKIDDELIAKPLTRKHYSGFSVHNGVRLARNDENGRESLAQYIICNPFSIKKINYNTANGRLFINQNISTQE